MFYFLLCYLIGLATIPAILVGCLLAIEVIEWWHRPKEPKPGTWVIYSWAPHGQDYSNGGRFTIWRYGTDSSVCWSPPMRTKEEALAECERRNAKGTA